MKATRILIPFVFSIASLAFAQDVTGDWHGTLNVNGAELRLLLHISKNYDGSLKATLDSIDQNANGIPVTSAALRGSTLSLKVDAVQGSYQGKVNAAGSEISGAWTQGTPLELTFHRGGIPAQAATEPAKPSDIDGDWLGTIDTGMGKLRLVLHIRNTDQGLAATLDSPDQNANGLPVTGIIRSGMSLRFEMKEIGGAYEGNMSSDLETFTGTWTQHGNSLPLAFKRVKRAVERDRCPQNPSRPYPDREEDVRFKNPGANALFPSA